MERWSQGPNVQDQGLKKFEAKAENRPSRGQEQKCSKPRLRTKGTILQVFSEKKKRVIAQEPHIFGEISRDLQNKKLKTKIKIVGYFPFSRIKK